MKKITKLILIIAAIFAGGTTNATQYCQTPITASDAVTSVKLSCQLISAGNYQIKVESDVAMDNFSPGVYCNINGVGGNQLIAQPGYVRSADGKTITVDIPSSSGPNLYTPLYILMPGEKVFTWPADVDWTGSCGPVVADTEIPTAFTATAGTIGANSVQLLLNATDNSGSIAYTISYGSGPTVVATTGVSASQKSYIVSGLSESTDYSFSVVAKDAAGNAAVNNPIVVNATTTAFPAVATPTVDAAKVISVYSGSYTNLPTTLQNWYGNTFSTVSLAGNEALKNTSVCCFGYEFTAKPINISTMTKLHIDIYSESLPSITVGITGGGEFKKSGIALTSGQWNSIDILLSDLTGADLANINQVGFWDLNGTFYLDNVYFYNESTTVDTEAPTAFTATAGTITSDEVQLLLNATDNSGLISYSISYGSGPTVVPTIGTSGVQKTVTISGLTGSSAYSFSVTAKDATGNTAANSPVVVAATTLASLPGAPVPTLDASKVISIFSNTYTNVAGTNFYPGWGQNTIATAAALSGNDAMKYTNFGYQGIELTGSVDASSLTKLHVDIYPVDETNIRITPISAGKEFSIVLAPLTLGQWNSYDIPLSSFTGVVLSGIIQFKLDGGTGKSFYMDNLYFFDDTNTGSSTLENSETINCFPNPFANQITVKAHSEINVVIVRNLLGQTVKTTVVNGFEKSIDLTNIAAGNYFITVKLVNGELTTKKIVKL